MEASFTNYVCAKDLRFKCGYFCMLCPSLTTGSLTLQTSGISSSHYGSEPTQTWKFPLSTIITGNLTFKILPYGHCTSEVDPSILNGLVQALRRNVDTTTKYHPETESTDYHILVILTVYISQSRQMLAKTESW